MLEKIDDINNKSIVFGGDFNLFFKVKLEAQGGNPVLKKKSLVKLIQIKQKFDLCDIRRIRNPNTKSYTFRQRHSSGYIQRRLITFSYLMFHKNLQKTIMFWLFFRFRCFLFLVNLKGREVKVSGNIITLYVRKVHTLIA